jgi:hypothetical protein
MESISLRIPTSIPVPQALRSGQLAGTPVYWSAAAIPREAVDPNAAPAAVAHAADSDRRWCAYLRSWGSLHDHYDERYDALWFRVFSFPPPPIALCTSPIAYSTRTSACASLGPIHLGHLGCGQENGRITRFQEGRDASDPRVIRRRRRAAIAR